MAFTGQLGTVNSKPGNVVPGYNTILQVQTGVQVGAPFGASPTLTAGINVGSSFFAFMDGTTAGIDVGSVFSLAPLVEEGIDVGSSFDLTNVYGPFSEGALVHSMFTCDSGDLTNGRYRR